MHLLSYRGCWHRISRCFLLRYRQKFRPSEQKFTSKNDVILHAVSLRQAFAHCGRFLTAASRRSMGRVSVPFWLVVLSDQLPVIDLVSRYLTNYLIGRRPLPNRKIFPLAGASGISPPFGGLSLSSGEVPTCYAAVRRSQHFILLILCRNKRTKCWALDLHVLGAPPAFTLSQDQTLRKKFAAPVE